MTTQNPIHYASEIFYELLRSGRIDKYERPDLWSFYKDPEVKEADGAAAGRKTADQTAGIYCTRYSGLERKENNISKMLKNKALRD